MIRPIIEIIGAIRGLGQWYRDGLERQEIWVDKKRGQGLPNEDGKRVPITLLIGSRQYSAGIRSTLNNKNITICPDLRDENNEKVSLAHALQPNGLGKNQRVILRIEEWKISVVPANLSPNLLIRKGI